MSGNRNTRGTAIEGSGEIKTVNVTRTFFSERGAQSKAICPFTNFIPIQYLEKMEFVADERTNTLGITTERLNDVFGERQVDLSIYAPEKIIEHKRKILEIKGASLLYRVISSGLFNKRRIYEYLESLLDFDKPQGFGNALSIISNNTREMHDAFGKWDVFQYTLRSCNGTVGNFHITTNTDGPANPTFHILPVILPQNLYYQRLHILLHGSVDLEHVVFLVNEELESDTFPIKGLQAMYVGRLKKILAATSGQVMLVPRGFIEDNCFILPFELAARKPVQRKKERDSIVRMFLQNALREASMLDWELYYDPMKDIPAPPPYTGPLVAPVGSTSMVDDRMSELVPQGRATVVLESGAVVHPPNQEMERLANMVSSMRQEMMDLVGIEPHRHPIDDIEGGHAEDSQLPTLREGEFYTTADGVTTIIADTEEENEEMEADVAHELQSVEAALLGANPDGEWPF